MILHLQLKKIKKPISYRWLYKYNIYNAFASPHYKLIQTIKISKALQ